MLLLLQTQRSQHWSQRTCRAHLWDTISSNRAAVFHTLGGTTQGNYRWWKSRLSSNTLCSSALTDWLAFVTKKQWHHWWKTRMRRDDSQALEAGGFILQPNGGLTRRRCTWAAWQQRRWRRSRSQCSWWRSGYCCSFHRWRAKSERCP